MWNPPFWTLGFLLVENGHDGAHLQTVEDARTGLCPVHHHPGGCGRRPRRLLGAAVEASIRPGCAHPHRIAIRGSSMTAGLLGVGRSPCKQAHIETQVARHTTGG
uniref:Uncharacterized protein n=1 Tax=Hippocampus comes TaxID=109280 RepID=A0A3Q2Y2R8_HIPCM